MNHIQNYIPVLSIAGSDPSGGAGIQADLKTISALGCYGMSVITAITVQNTVGVTAVNPVSPELIRAQLTAVISDIPPLAIKTGMLFDAEIIRSVGSVISEYPDRPPVVIDPVMAATSGEHLLQPNAIDCLIHQLLPFSTLITPNIPEAEILSGISICSESDADEAGKRILLLGANAVLIKGGHSSGNYSIDLLYTGKGEKHRFLAQKIDSTNTHGTGCTLSAAIASFLARGLTLEMAVERSKKYLTNAISHGKGMKIGQGHGPVHHFYDLWKKI